MKIRIKLANTERARKCHYCKGVGEWWRVSDYIDELRQAAIWSKE
jgi:hypothetical protein